MLFKEIRPNNNCAKWECKYCFMIHTTCLSCYGSITLQTVTPTLSSSCLSAFSTATCSFWWAEISETNTQIFFEAKTAWCSCHLFHSPFQSLLMSFINPPVCLVHIRWCWLGSSQLICPGLWGWSRLGLQSEKPSHFSLHPTFSIPLPLYFTRWPIFMTHGGGVMFRSFVLVLLTISVQRCITDIPVRRLKLDKMFFAAQNTM